MPPILLALRTMGSGRGFGCSAVRPNLDRNEWFDQGLSELILERLCSTMAKRLKERPFHCHNRHLARRSHPSPLLTPVTTVARVAPSSPHPTLCTVFTFSHHLSWNPALDYKRAAASMSPWLHASVHTSFPLFLSIQRSILDIQAIVALIFPRSLADLGSTYTPSGLRLDPCAAICSRPLLHLPQHLHAHYRFTLIPFASRIRRHFVSRHCIATK